MPDITGRAPGPAVGAADHCAGLVAQEDAVQPAVGVTGRLHVEFIKAVFEHADVGGVRIGIDDEIGHLAHHSPWSTWVGRAKRSVPTPSAERGGTTLRV